MRFWLALLCLAAMGDLRAQWWNPLAPKNFEDCVLEKMKGVTSDSAAVIIARACREKFSNKDTPQPADKKELRSGIPSFFFWVSGFQHLLGKVELGKWQGKYINVTNRTDFLITQLKVGVPGKATNGKCENVENAYSEVHEMGLEYGGISPGMTRRGWLPDAFPSSKYFCIVGIVGNYQNDVDDWYKKIQK